MLPAGIIRRRWVKKLNILKHMINYYCFLSVIHLK